MNKNNKLWSVRLIMKKYCISCITLLLISFTILNAAPNVSSKLKFSTNTQQLQELIFGVNAVATDSVDYNLGEIGAPRILPPDPNIFVSMFVIYDPKILEDGWSYKDFRPIQQIRSYLVKYELYVHFGDAKYVTIEWGKLPALVDSARLMDPWDDLDLININMMDSTRTILYNKYIEDLVLWVWYRNPDVSVIEENDDFSLKVYPNPFNDNFILESKSNNIVECRIYSQLGKEIALLNSDGKYVNIDLQNIEKGVYFLRATLDNGKYLVKKIMKI